MTEPGPKEKDRIQAGAEVIAVRGPEQVAGRAADAERAEERDVPERTAEGEAREAAREAGGDEAAWAEEGAPECINNNFRR